MPAFRLTRCALPLAALRLAVAAHAPPVVVVDLAKDPRERWAGAVNAILHRHPWEFSFGQVFAAHNATLFDRLSAEQWDSLGGALRTHWPETAAELEGIREQFADNGHPEVSFNYLAGWLYFHELGHSDPASYARECTGILVNAADGTVLHGGNMDQQPAAARNLTLRVRFVDGEANTVFEGVDWYAVLSTGVSRAVRKGLASVQENWRHSPGRPLDDILADIAAGVVSQMLVFRQQFVAAHRDAAAGKPHSFEDFAAGLQSVQLAAPFYVVVAGPRQGEALVITRGLRSVDNLARLLAAGQLAPDDDYFLAQCNTDRQVPDDPNDPRRTAAEAIARQLGASEGASLLGLMAMLSTFPVHNPHTAYSAFMSAATGELHAFVREAMCPIDPAASVVQEKRYCRAAGPPGAVPAPALAGDRSSLVV